MGSIFPLITSLKGGQFCPPNKKRVVDMKKIKSAHIMLVIIAFVQFVFTSGLAIVFPEVPTVLLLLLSQLSIIIPFAIYCIVTKQNPLKIIRFKKIKWHTILLSIAVVLCSYPVIILLNFVTMLFVDNAMINVMPEILALGLPVGVALMALAPALFEETIFRGMLYNTYSKRRPIAGIILSALLFGLMHQNFNQMPYAFFLGLIMAFMLEASDTIIAPMIMHFTLNGISTVASFFTMDAAAVEMTSAEDFKQIILESFEISMAQSGMPMTTEELTAMLPVLIGIVIAVFAVIALIALAVVIALIYAVFRLNNRRPKEVFRADHSDTLMIEDKQGKLKKNRMIDLWLIIFIVYALAMCVLSIFI